MNSDDIVSSFSDGKDDNLKITLEKVAVSNGLCLDMSGYIDTYNSNFFQRKMEAVVDSGYINLIFDCAALNYISSTGIGALVALLKTVKSKGGDIVLLKIPANVLDALRLLGFSQVFNIVDTRDEALSFFMGNEPFGGGVFPKVIACPVCTKRLKAMKAGRFRCSECKAILSVDSQGIVSLG